MTDDEATTQFQAAERRVLDEYGVSAESRRVPLADYRDAFEPRPDDIKVVVALR